MTLEKSARIYRNENSHALTSGILQIRKIFLRVMFTLLYWVNLIKQQSLIVRCSNVIKLASIKHLDSREVARQRYLKLILRLLYIQYKSVSLP